MENLDNFNIPPLFKDELVHFLRRLKLSGKIRGKNEVGPESYSHVHYNVLFLKINESNSLIIRRSSKDLLMHKYCFNVDLNNCLEIEIIRINILKRIIF